MNGITRWVERCCDRFEQQVVLPMQHGMRCFGDKIGSLVQRVTEAVARGFRHFIAFFSRGNRGPNVVNVSPPIIHVGRPQGASFFHFRRVDQVFPELQHALEAVASAQKCGVKDVVDEEAIWYDGACLPALVWYLCIYLCAYENVMLTDKYVFPEKIRSASKKFVGFDQQGNVVELYPKNQFRAWLENFVEAWKQQTLDQGATISMQDDQSPEGLLTHDKLTFPAIMCDGEILNGFSSWIKG